MNIPTIVVLVILAALLGIAIRSMLRSSKDGHCNGCSNEGCGGAGTVDACPATQRALADLEARLGPAVPHDNEDAEKPRPRS